MEIFLVFPTKGEPPFTSQDFLVNSTPPNESHESLLTLHATLGCSFLVLQPLLEQEECCTCSFFQTPWPLQKNRNALGGRLRCGGRLYVKGLGMHATARAAYDLTPQDRTFQAEIALDDRAGRQGSVIFRVYLNDAQGSWSKAYESPVIRGGEAPRTVSVDVADAGRLALIVDSADRGAVLDHANWLNARLLRNME